MSNGWNFFKFGLIVTGDGERDFAPRLFKDLTSTGKCTFVILRQTGQRNPIGAKKQLAYIKTGKKIPDKDAEIICEARGWLLAEPSRHVIWLDDLESSQRQNAHSKFQRLRKAIDVVLARNPKLRERFAVHFFVNMVEAYYFACVDVVNQVLGLSLSALETDCENIEHPKGELKRAMRNLGLGKSFDEKVDGERIVESIALEQVLNRPLHCRALRTLVAWCCEVIGEPRTERFQLSGGLYWDVTAQQLRSPPPVEKIGPLDPG